MVDRQTAAADTAAVTTANPLAASAQLAANGLIEIARRDAAVFCALILKDEETGRPIRLEDFQEEWHDRADTGEDMIVMAAPEMGKTQNLAIGRTIWHLGKNPRKRFAVFSETRKQSVRIVTKIAEHIASNPEVRKVFPHLRPGRKWTEGEIEVVRPLGIKSPSVQAASLETGILGERLDGLILDDILSEKNTRTPYQREKLESTLKTEVFSRLQDGAQVIFLTNAWHPEDLAHALEKQGWWLKRYPVMDANDVPLWPDKWSPARIQEARDQRFGPLEFARVMMCQARDEGSARFRSEWIDLCKERGRGYSLWGSLEEMSRLDEDFAFLSSVARLGGAWPEGFFTVTGVDLGVKQKQGSDLTVLFTILVWPDGTKQVLDIKSGRFTGPAIIEKIVDTHLNFGSTVIVESNAAQDFIVQFARANPLVKQFGIPIIPFNTGRNKLSVDFGVESIAAELSMGQWIIPCDIDTMAVDPEVAKWIQGMLYYDPGAHTADHLMASWFAKEYARSRMLRMRRGSGASQGVNVIG